MRNNNPIKVVKRVEREQYAQVAGGGACPELSAREKARELAATVNEWISECRQTRLTRHQEMEQRFGLRHDRSQARDIE